MIQPLDGGKKNNKKMAYKLKTHNSAVAKAYALPKMHKPNLK